MTIALFGIDGSGKSTLGERIRARSAENVGLMSCPRYHHTPGSPRAELSATLDRMNGTGDALGSVEWKMIAVYLQLCLYGTVRDALFAAGPKRIVSERHPLVDALVYGPYFSERIARNLGADELRERFFPALEKAEPGAEKRVRDFVAEENRRIGRDLTVGELPLYLKSLFGGSPDEMLAELPRHFGTPMPDVAVFLDVSVGTALARIRARGNPAELHENEAGLEKLRAGYLRAFGWLATNRPNLRQVKISVETDGKAREPDSIADEILALGKETR